MKRKISEYSYGFALTHELTTHYGGLFAAATALPAEDAAFGLPLFLQFKVSEQMRRRTSAEAKLLKLPYYRFTPPRRSHSDQHRLLLELAAQGFAVYYAAPLFYEVAVLNQAFFTRSLAEHSFFVAPGEIGNWTDNEDHRVAFGAEAAYFCPEQRPLTEAFRGGDLAAFIAAATAQKEFQPVNEAFFGQLTDGLLSIIRQQHLFADPADSLREHEMSLPVFAAYLARTFFDCELLILTAPPKQAAGDSVN